MKKLFGLLLACVGLLSCVEQSRTIYALGEADCTVRPCSVEDAGVSVSLSLPQRVQPLEPFEVALNLTGVDQVQTVEVDFVMQDMDMGQNRYRLSRGDDGAWYGQPMLPVCVTGRSDWQAVVDIKTKKISYRAKFDFIVN